jgi:hypothetical protein
VPDGCGTQRKVLTTIIGLGGGLRSLRPPARTFAAAFPRLGVVKRMDARALDGSLLAECAEQSRIARLSGLQVACTPRSISGSAQDTPPTQRCSAESPAGRHIQVAGFVKRPQECAQLQGSRLRPGDLENAPSSIPLRAFSCALLRCAPLFRHLFAAFAPFQHLPGPSRQCGHGFIPVAPQTVPASSARQ